MLVPYAVSEDLAVLLREGPNFENTRRLFLGRCSHLGEGHVQFHRKILRPNGKTLDEFESSICQAFLELGERQLALRAPLKELNITAAKEAEVGGGWKIIICVPIPQLKSFPGNPSPASL